MRPSRAPVVEVAVWSSVKKTLAYQGPADLPTDELIGRRVIVPVGSRQQVGLITGLEAEYSGNLRQIVSLCDAEAVMTENELSICRFISEYYFASLAECIKAWLPGALTSRLRQSLELLQPERLRQLVDSGDETAKALADAFGRRHLLTPQKTARFDRRELQDLRAQGIIGYSWELKQTDSRQPELRVIRGDGDGDHRRLGRKAISVLEWLEKHGDSDLADLRKELNVRRSTIDALERRGLIRLAERPPFDPDATPTIRNKLKLTDAQRIAVERIQESIDAARFAPYLLHGVTASGKTEVYLRAIKHAISLGKTAIIIVPEIGLAQALYYRIRDSLGPGVGLLHSRLTARSRLQVWQRIRDGRIRVVMGPRSAVFAPSPQLGLIVIDEEHDGSLKQESPAPRYHARDVALYRARQEDCTVVLGSATPAIESYYNARAGKYKLLSLPERVDRRQLPAVRTVDLKQTFAAGGYGYLSEELI
jgi:primosomal protein N' (replication factor Y)